MDVLFHKDSLHNYSSSKPDHYRLAPQSFPMHSKVHYYSHISKFPKTPNPLLDENLPGHPLLNYKYIVHHLHNIQHALRDLPLHHHITSYNTVLADYDNRFHLKHSSCQADPDHKGKCSPVLLHLLQHTHHNHQL